jgi:hypothetical protein
MPIISAPKLPGSLALLPETLQQSLIPKGVHRLPETLVVVGGKVAALSQSLQRLLLPGALVTVHKINHGWVEHEETAVDPAAIALGLLFKGEHPAPLKRQRAESPWRLNGCECCAASLPAVEIDQSADIDIGNTIAISKAKSFLANMLPYTP